MGNENADGFAWVIILFSAFFYFFGRAHGKLAEKKRAGDKGE